MKDIFFRQNKNLKSNFLNIFLFDQMDSLLSEYKDNKSNYEKVKKEVLNVLNKYINGIYEIDNGFKILSEYLKIRKYINKNKKIPDSIKKDINLKNYNYALISFQIKNSELLKKYNSIFDKEKLNLLSYFKDEDIVLSRNKDLRRYLDNKNQEIVMKPKILLSLYGLACQLSLKTGAFGLTGQVGMLHNVQNEWELIRPKNKYIVRVQGYLLNRLLKKVLLENLDRYKGKFYINHSFKLLKNKFVFDVLLDNPKSSLFLNMEKQVAIENNSLIKKLVSLKNPSNIDDLHEFLTYKQIKSLIKLGIIYYEGMDDFIDFTWITKQFNDPFIKCNQKLSELEMRLKNLNKHFDFKGFQYLLKEYDNIFDLLDISIQGNLPLTIDTFVDTSKNVEINNNNIKDLQKKLESLSLFISTMDTSKYIQDIVYKYFLINFPEGVTLSHLDISIHDFFNDITKYISTKINTGKLRTGFLHMDIIDLILKKYTSLDNDVVLDKPFVETYMKNHKSGYFHSYSYFIQKYKDKYVINHIYKGYGVFTRRFDKNFDSRSSDYLYGLPNLYDFPYNFGFNVDYRKYSKNIVLDIFPDTRFKKSNYSIKINDLKIVVNRNEKRIQFFNKNNKEIFFSYLGSLNPIAYPPMLLEVNTLTLNSSLYFDLGDVLLRNMYEKNPNLKSYTVPNIFYLNKKLLLSRGKTLFNSGYLLSIFNKSSDILTFRNLLLKLNNNKSSFFIREFVVDFNEYNRRMRKPVYIDINQPIALSAFISYLKKNKWVVLENPFPDPKDNPENNYKEFIFETDSLGVNMND